MISPTTTLDLYSLQDTFAVETLTRISAWLDPLVLVGGSVRDALLGRPLHDLDLVVAHNALATARRIADELGGAFFPLDTERDIGRALLSDPAGNPLVLDVARWRGASLAEDLAARDFTINALAARIETNTAQVLDVTGGLVDLHARKLRVASPQALSNDPLRGLRAVRLLAELSAWQFRLEPDTAAQIRQYAPHLVVISHERVRDELMRTLLAPQPWRSLQRWAELGLLTETLPEAAALQGVTQSAPHIYDVFEHTGQTLEQLAWLADWIVGRAEPRDAWDEAASAVLLRWRAELAAHKQQPLNQNVTRGDLWPWLALCHDWGKPATRSVTPSLEGGPPQVQFIGHEAVSAQLAEAALQRLRFSDAQINLVSTVASGHMRPHHLAAAPELPSRRAIFRFYRALGAAGVETALFSLADVRGMAGPTLSLPYWQRQLAVVSSLLDAYFSRSDEIVQPVPLLSGYDIMTALGLMPGPQVGKLLTLVMEAQAAGEVHTRAEALSLATQMVETGIVQ